MKESSNEEIKKNNELQENNIQVQDNAIVNEPTEVAKLEKKSNTVTNIIIVVLIVAVIIGGVFAYQKIGYKDNSIDDDIVHEKPVEDDKTETTTTTTITTITTSQKQDNNQEENNSTNDDSNIIKDNYKDGDYRRYSLIVENSNQEQTFKLSGNRTISIKADFEDYRYSLNVNNNSIIINGRTTDGVYNYEEEYWMDADDRFEIILHVFGNYLVFEVPYDYFDDNIYIVGPDNKLVDSESYYDVNSESFSKNGMKFYSQVMEQSEEDVCSNVLMSEEEKRTTVYSYDYVYEYKNGILDTKGKRVDIVYFSDRYKNDPNYQEDYEYCKENWNKSE